MNPSFTIKSDVGDTIDIPYEVQNADGSQRNITGETVTFLLAQTETGAKALPAKQGVATAPISGQGMVSLTSAETGPLAGAYFAWFVLTYADGITKKTIAKGTVFLDPKPA